MVLAVEWNGDQINTMKFLGLVLCMIGVFGYVWQKYTNYYRSMENQYGILSNDDNKHLTLPESDVDESDNSNSSTEMLFDILNRHS